MLSQWGMLHIILMCKCWIGFSWEVLGKRSIVVPAVAISMLVNQTYLELRLWQVPFFPTGKGEAIEAILAALQVVSEPFRSFANTLVDICAYAGQSGLTLLRRWEWGVCQCVTECHKTQWLRSDGTLLGHWASECIWNLVPVMSGAFLNPAEATVGLNCLLRLGNAQWSLASPSLVWKTCPSGLVFFLQDLVMCWKCSSFSTSAVSILIPRRRRKRKRKRRKRTRRRKRTLLTWGPTR